MFQSNKPLIPVYYDNYQFIDNLMNLYANKKLTLTDLEIKLLGEDIAKNTLLS